MKLSRHYSEQKAFSQANYEQLYKEDVKFRLYITIKRIFR